MAKKPRQAKRLLKGGKIMKRKKKEIANIVQECFNRQYSAVYVTIDFFLT